MTSARKFLSLSLGLVYAAIAAISYVSAAEAPAIKLRFAYSTASPYTAGIFTALEQGSFKRNGLDIEPIFVQSGALTVGALLSQQVKMATASGEAVLNAYKKGATDLVILGTTVEKFEFALYTNPRVVSAKDLVDSKIAISRLGGTSHVALLFALSHLGLDPMRDKIAILQTGSDGAGRIAALSRGNLDGAMLSGLEKLKASDLGAKKFLDLANLNFAFPQLCIVTTKSFLRDNRKAATSFLKAYVEGITMYLDNPELGKKVISKYRKVNDPRLIEFDYYNLRPLLLKNPVTQIEPVVTALKVMGVTNKEDQHAIYRNVVDNSIIKVIRDDK